MARPEKLTFRPMTATDIPQAMMLVKSANWNQTPGDWEMLLRSPGQISIAISDGQLVATTAAIDYRDFIWIAMVLVHPEYRRRGIATQMLELVLRSYNQRIIRLDATEEGSKVYHQLGFFAVDHLIRWKMENNNQEIQSIHAINTEIAIIKDLKTVYQYDRSVFGGDRSTILETIFTQNRASCLSINSASEPQYIFSRPGISAFHLGPLVAQSEKEAKILLNEMVKRLPSHLIFMDAFDHSPWNNYLHSIGFMKQRKFIRMQLNSNKEFGIRERQFAIGGPELG